MSLTAIASGRDLYGALVSLAGGQQSERLILAFISEARLSVSNEQRGS